MRHQIILFIEPEKEAWQRQESIANLFMNRFSIDEKTAHEILGVYYLEPPYWKTIENGIEIAAKNAMDNSEYHIICAGMVHKKECMVLKKNFRNLMQKHRMSSILLTQFQLTQKNLSSFEDVESAYKDDQGITLWKSPCASMTEEYRQESFQFLLCLS